ncbi:hypothetical protein [Rhizobium rhizophilum]|uniref:Uncharacterized protein n=1 Tax=Rhizobium rhizophilum TaxID=1850373 RepID=A0ABY2QT29_9HYPH|nr:hypothetical protein [Rhizobium rhizophilum]THV13752.1 hypothetical protein E9677_12655 [Rhizobium rhizophilum]
MIEFATTTPPPAPRPSCRHIAVGRLADIICELQGSGEPVTEEELTARNIPLSIATRYRDQALEAARRNFVKQV